MDKRYKTWLQKVYKNYSTVQTLVKNQHENDSNEAICFFCHLTCETLLKALFVKNQIDIIKTHNLPKLYNLLVDEGVSLPAEMQDICYKLNGYSVQTRYDEVLQITNEEMLNAYNLCSEFLKDYVEDMEEATALDGAKSVVVIANSSKL
ncbi:MAG: HEPN domain-containing protein [Enterococcus sp.]|nr:HEPN domain-containing protein [Enterococcus sp.]